MPAARRRSSARGRFARPGIAVGILAVVLLVTVAFVGVAVQRNAVSRDVTTLSVEIAQEQARNIALQAAVAEKATQSYVADKARELGYVRPGEGILALDTPQRLAERSAPDRPERDRLTRWVMLFFGSR